MEVNDELGALEQGLRALTDRLEIGGAHCRHYLPFAGRSDREKFLPRSQPRMARSTGMAGAATQSGLRFAVDHVEAGRARRNRTARQPAFAQRETARGGKNQMNRSRRKTIQLDRCAFAGALDCDHGFSRADRIDLRLPHYSAASIWAISKKPARERAGQFAQPERRRQRADRGADFALALQRRLKEGYLKMIPIAEQNIVRLDAGSLS